MNFYEVKVRYAKQTGEQATAMVKESYIVEDETFGGAESTTQKEIAPYAFGESIEVFSMKRMKIYDMVDVENAEAIFKCKVDMIAVEDSGKEVATRVVMYVGADTLEGARKRIAEHLSGLDAKLVSVEETKLLDVFRLESK